MSKKLPIDCPSCTASLHVKSLHCGNCGTEVTGSFPMPLLSRLTEEEQAFIIAFVMKSGSLKEMAQWKGLSYPTVRNMLDELIQKIDSFQKEK